MFRRPVDCGPNAWKGWLKNGAKLIDRVFMSWLLVWWGLSFLAAYAADRWSYLPVLLVLTAISYVAFGMNMAVFDQIANGKVQWKHLIIALTQEWKALRSVYLKSILRRACLGVLFASIIVSLAIVLVSLVGPPDPKNPPPVSTSAWWNSWAVWAWVWVIPAGWQRGGMIGWSYWLSHREQQDPQVSHVFIQNAIALNYISIMRSSSLLMLVAISLLVFFPPLLPIWDLFAMAVCWSAWDEMSGKNNGIKALVKEKSKVHNPSGVTI